MGLFEAQRFAQQTFDPVAPHRAAVARTDHDADAKSRCAIGHEPKHEQLVGDAAALSAGADEVGLTSQPGAVRKAQPRRG